MQTTTEIAGANAARTGVASAVDSQARVNCHFESAAKDWERIYHESTLYGRIYRDRMKIALRWIERLDLPGGARILDVGCGAGFAAAALAKRGYQVEAVDAVPAMIHLTRKRLADTNGAEPVRVSQADVRSLPMSNGRFDLVFALGVLPWLDDTLEAVREMARVTRPNGYVLVTADNAVHLEEILDPARAPILRPIRQYVASALRAAKLLPTPPALPKIHRHSQPQIDSVLRKAGLDRLWSVMVGFGPFTLFGKPLFPDSMGIKLHRLLQTAANRNWPIVSRYGMQCVVMAAKRATA